MLCYAWKQFLLFTCLATFCRWDIWNETSRREFGSLRNYVWSTYHTMDKIYRVHGILKAFVLLITSVRQKETCHQWKKSRKHEITLDCYLKEWIPITKSKENYLWWVYSSPAWIKDRQKTFTSASTKNSYSRVSKINWRKSDQWSVITITVMY